MLLFLQLNKIRRTVRNAPIPVLDALSSVHQLSEKFKVERAKLDEYRKALPDLLTLEEEQAETVKKMSCDLKDAIDQLKDQVEHHYEV